MFAETVRSIFTGYFRVIVGKISGRENKKESIQKQADAAGKNHCEKQTSKFDNSVCLDFISNYKKTHLESKIERWEQCLERQPGGENAASMSLLFRYLLPSVASSAKSYAPYDYRL